MTYYYAGKQHSTAGRLPHYAYVPVDPFKPSLAFSLDNVLGGRGAKRPPAPTAAYPRSDRPQPIVQHNTEPSGSNRQPQEPHPSLQHPFIPISSRPPPSDQQSGWYRSNVSVSNDPPPSNEQPSWSQYFPASTNSHVSNPPTRSPSLRSSEHGPNLGSILDSPWSPYDGTYKNDFDPVEGRDDEWLSNGDCSSKQDYFQSTTWNSSGSRSPASSRRRTCSPAPHRNPSITSARHDHTNYTLRIPPTLPAWRTVPESKASPIKAAPASTASSHVSLNSKLSIETGIQQPSPYLNEPSTGAYIFAFMFDTVPRQVYLYMLLCLPYLYFSRVTRIFEEAEMSMPMIKHGILDAARAKGEGDGWTGSQKDHPPIPWVYDMEPAVDSVAYANLQNTWVAFIDSLLKEWKTLNIISVLLLSAILTILQIESAASDPLTRCSALLSMVCALMSLLYGCTYIIRFGTMRKTYKGAEWAEEAQKTRTGIWWNIWVLLAMPATWLAWSMILYITTIMAFVWRTSPFPSTTSNLVTPSSGLSVQILVPRIVISVVLTVGLVYFTLIAATLRKYGEIMDRAWQNRIWRWMRDGISDEAGLEEQDVDAVAAGESPFDKKSARECAAEYGEKSIPQVNGGDSGMHSPGYPSGSQKGPVRRQSSWYKPRTVDKPGPGRGVLGEHTQHGFADAQFTNTDNFLGPETKASQTCDGFLFAVPFMSQTPIDMKIELILPRPLQPLPQVAQDLSSSLLYPTRSGSRHPSEERRPKHDTVVPHVLVSVSARPSDDDQQGSVMSLRPNDSSEIDKAQVSTLMERHVLLRRENGKGKPRKRPKLKAKSGSTSRLQTPTDNELTWNNPGGTSMPEKTVIKMIKLFGLSSDEPFSDTLWEHDLVECGLTLEALGGDEEWERFKMKIRTALSSSSVYSTEKLSKHDYLSLLPILDEFNVNLRLYGIEGQIALCEKFSGLLQNNFAIYYFTNPGIWPNQFQTVPGQTAEQTDVETNKNETVRRYDSIPNGIDRLDVISSMSSVHAAASTPHYENDDTNTLVTKCKKIEARNEMDINDAEGLMETRTISLFSGHQ